MSSFKLKGVFVSHEPRQEPECLIEQTDVSYRQRLRSIVHLIAAVQSLIFDCICKILKRSRTGICLE